MDSLAIKDIPWGAGHDLKMYASWVKGDKKNVIATSAASPKFAMVGGVPGQFGPSGTYGFGATTDGVWLPVANGGDGNIHLTESFGFRGAYNHNWDPYWSSSLFGGIGVVRYDGTAKSEFCAVFGVTHPGLNVTYSCDPNFSVAQIGTVTRWTPVKNLTFSGEVLYTKLHQNLAGFSTFTPGAPQPTHIWTFHDQSTLALNLRVQRNFRSQSSTTSFKIPPPPTHPAFFI